MLFQDLSHRSFFFFLMFFGKLQSGVPVLTNPIHLVLNPPQLLWWSLLLIVAFDTGIPSSSSGSGQLLWGFFSPTEFFSHELSVAEQTSALCLFKNVAVDLVIPFGISLLGLFWVLQPNDGLLHWQQQLLGTKIQMQIPLFKWTLDPLSAHC